MNNRRDQQGGRQQFGRHNAEYEGELRGGGMRGGQGPGHFSGRQDFERPYGYGEGMFGGFSYGEEGMRGRGGPAPRPFPNENLANDFSLEATRNFARDEQRVSHRGKGPKNYKRSDERIREDASEILADHHEIDASNIELTVKDGELTLSGTVADRRTKRLAEHVLEEVSGVLDIHNQVRIAKAETAAPASRANGNQTAARPH